MMRSGKRGDTSWQDDRDQGWTPEEEEVMEEDPDIGEESADLGINLDALDNSKLRRVSRSGVGRNKWGGVHMLRTGKRSSQASGTGQGWGSDFLRSLRSRAGLSRRGGRRSWFGGGHMLRSGKRSSWGPWGPEEEEDGAESVLHLDGPVLEIN